MGKLFVDVIEKRYVGVDTTERYAYQYPIIITYLKRKMEGWVFWDFFNKFPTSRVALYAVTEFTELILQDYNNYKGTCDVICVADRDYKKFNNGYMNYNVVSMNELLKMKKVKDIDYIVNCSIFHENEIYDALMKNGINQEDIISINSIVFERG